MPISVSPGDDFQAAVDAAAGDTLQLAAGDYWLRDVIVSKPCNIVGQGPAFSRLHLEDGASWGLDFQVPRLGGIEVSGLFLDLRGCSGWGLRFPYGLEQGTLAKIQIIGQWSLAAGAPAPTGIQLCAVHPSGTANDNQYQTLIDRCRFSGLKVGMWMTGKNALGCRPNLNQVYRSKFQGNACHIQIDHGSDNTIAENNFNPVTGATDPRVLVTGPWSSNTFRGNYWDNLTQQLCVRHSGFASHQPAYSAITVEGGDNQPASAYVVDGHPDAVCYRGMYR